LGEGNGHTSEADGDLARRLAGGDRAAEAVLFRRLAPRVRLYGLRHLRDPGAADDLVQDVLLMTFESLREGRVREPEKLASFVLGTCRKVAAGWRRQAERRSRLLETHGWQLAPTEGTEAAPLDLDRLTGCLGLLSERERLVVVLSFYAERSADDIGSELGMSSGNVRVVRHRALLRLRACVLGDA
jgi:RNA polymerase sigma-70 factor (ECF subfamily)